MQKTSSYAACWLALTSIAWSTDVHCQSRDPDLAHWEAAAGARTKEKPGRYAAPLPSAGPRYPKLVRAGKISFFTGLGAAVVCGGGAALLSTQFNPNDESLGSLGALVGTTVLGIIGGVGALTMVTGGVLWGVGATHPPETGYAFRLTTDGVAVDF